MNKFTQAVAAANLAGAIYGANIALVIYVGQDKDADATTILNAVRSCNRMISDTRRILAMVEHCVELRDTAKLTFDAWWAAFKEVNKRVETPDEDFNAVLEAMYVQIETGSLDDKINYFWDEIMPTVHQVHEMIPMLKAYLKDLALAKQTLDSKRKSAM